MGEVAFSSMKMETLTCGQCGTTFAVPQHWLNARRDSKENGGAFNCPNGHPRVFTEPEVDRLKRELAQREASLKAATERADRTWLSLQQAQSKLNAVKRRVGNGTCPCCKRSFVQLRRHMEHKHPHYKQPADIP